MGNLLVGNLCVHYASGLLGEVNKGTEGKLAFQSGKTGNVNGFLNEIGEKRYSPAVIFLLCFALLFYSKLFQKALEQKFILFSFPCLGSLYSLRFRNIDCILNEKRGVANNYYRPLYQDHIAVSLTCSVLVALNTPRYYRVIRAFHMGITLNLTPDTV